MRKHTLDKRSHINFFTLIGIEDFRNHASHPLGGVG